MIQIIQSCDNCGKNQDAPNKLPPEGWFSIPDSLSCYNHRDKRQHVSLEGDETTKIACSLDCAKSILAKMVQELKPYKE